MQVSAKLDYAVRALIELSVSESGQRTRQEMATAQDIPPRYLEAVLVDLRRAGLVVGQRGASGGYQLGRSTDSITVADIARAVDGPLTLVQGERPESVTYAGSSRHLHELWIGLRAALRTVLETVTLQSLVSGDLPTEVRALVDDPDAWLPH